MLILKFEVTNYLFFPYFLTDGSWYASCMSTTFTSICIENMVKIWGFFVAFGVILTKYKTETQFENCSCLGRVTMLTEQQESLQLQ